MSAEPTISLEIPAKPEVMDRLDRLFADDYATVDQVCDIVEHDVATAAAVIHTANSPLFGSRQFSSVRHAINYLGMRDVAGIARMVCLRNLFVNDRAFNEIWYQSSHRAVAASRLAPLVGVSQDEAQTAALFMQCGQLVMCASREYREAISESLPPEAMAALERRLFGCTAADVTEALCDKWRLGERVRDALLGRTSDTETARLECVVTLAQQIAVRQRPDDLSEQAKCLGVQLAVLIVRVQRVEASLQVG